MTRIGPAAQLVGLWERGCATIATPGTCDPRSRPESVPRPRGYAAGTSWSAERAERTKAFLLANADSALAASAPPSRIPMPLVSAASEPTGTACLLAPRHDSTCHCCRGRRKPAGPVKLRTCVRRGRFSLSASATRSRATRAGTARRPRHWMAPTSASQRSLDAGAETDGVDAFWSGRRVLRMGHTGFKGEWLSLWLQRLGAEATGLPATSRPIRRYLSWPASPTEFGASNSTCAITRPSLGRSRRRSRRS